MPIIAVVIALAAIVWGAIYARRGSLAVGCGLLISFGYVFGHEFWNTNVGPLPITLDRIALVGLLAALVVQWRFGRVKLRPLTSADWAVGGLIAIVAMSAILSGSPDMIEGVTSKWGRLLTSFLIPVTLYFILRQVQLSTRDCSRLLLGLVLLGVYLTATGFFEVAGKWSLVFPRYIADPGLGTHFGRARGPELNAVSLGLYLTATIWCAWTLAKVSPKRWQQLALMCVLPLMAGGILLTYTRSTWLGLAASAVVVGAIEIPRRWRIPSLAATALAGMLVLAVSWSHLVGLEREGSAEESTHSVDQRTSFAYVSWQMFCDNPVFGVGFGRFYDRKLPYLSDRSQDFELESIRTLHHHNTLLSFLTETGIFGVAAFVAMIVAWARAAWWLATNSNSPRWIRAQGILMLALVTNYLCSALFHDLTLIPSQHVLLFAFAGIIVNLRQTMGSHAVGATAGLPSSASSAATLRPTYGQVPAAANAINLFGMEISNITMQDTVTRVLDWCREPFGSTCRYVVTPNVDHAVLFQQRADLRAAYADASLVLADGAPIVLASRLVRQPLPERVAGSDLVPRLLQSTATPLKVFLLGAGPGVAEIAAARIERRWPMVTVVGAYSPPPGFENDEVENSRILARVAAASPDLLIVGLGAPKQELWVHRHREQLQAKVALCVGATIDFLAGHRSRSPVWMRRTGLEWLHRVGTEPRRLAARYARDAWVFPQLVWREWRRELA